MPIAFDPCTLIAWAGRDPDNAKRAGMAFEPSKHGVRACASAGHDSDAPQALIDFMSEGWIERAPSTGVHAQVQRFAARRETLSRSYPGTTILVPSGQLRVRANDTFFRFRSGSDFAYLVGNGEPGAVLVLETCGDGHRSVLFARAHNRGTAAFFTDRMHGELWVGRHRGVAESQRYYGCDECRPLSLLPPYLQALAASTSSVVVLRGLDEDVDAAFSARDDDAQLAACLCEMRLVKDEWELDQLRKACAITKRGFEDAISAMRNARSEREIEGAFSRRARIEGNDVGYLTIAASGDRACTLHWNHNDGEMDPNSLLLLDAGVECDSLYTADVTRTLPVSGGYSAKQRTIYDLVWGAQRAAMAAVAPGNDFLEPNRRAMRVLAGGLIDLGIARGSIDELLDPQRASYRRYTLHNVSHMLGLDVHDCARARSQAYRYGTLRQGMVLTIEPGLYFQPDDATVPLEFRGIGVRIEDDVAVTASGYENLSAGMPSVSGDVERWIAGVWARN